MALILFETMCSMTTGFPNTFWTGGAALSGHVLYAHALHASDATCSLSLLQQHGAGPCLPACECYPERCQ